MSFVLLKILITAFLIVAITEIAKLNDRMGGLIAAMPITTFLILFWLYFENVSINKISNHMTYTLLYLIPTVPMFLIFPFCINKFGFWIAILLAILVTLIATILVHHFSKYFDFKFF